MNPPSHAILETLRAWGEAGSVKGVATNLGISFDGAQSRLKRAREHYGVRRTADAWEECLAYGHTVENRVTSLEQIVRSLLCHDPNVPELLNAYYARYGRGLLEVSHAK